MVSFNYFSPKKITVIFTIGFTLLLFLVLFNFSFSKGWLCPPFSFDCLLEQKPTKLPKRQFKDGSIGFLGVVKKIEGDEIILVPKTEARRKEEKKVVFTQETKFNVRPYQIFPEGATVVSADSSELKVGDQVELFAKEDKGVFVAFLVEIFR